jgi:Spy/CpxP family protein refolding chaperone
MNMNKAMKTISVLGVAMALSLGMAATATAFPGGHGGIMHHRFERMADKLDLSDEQWQQFKQIHRKARPQMLELKDAMQDNREALRKLKPESSQFDKQVAKLARQQGELVTQRVIQHNQVRARVFAILTSEQREKAEKMKRNHFRGHGKQGGQHGRL